MKIALISIFPPYKGGVSTYSRRNIEALRKLNGDVTPINLYSIYECLVLLPKLTFKKFDLIRWEFNVPTYGLGTFIIIIYLFITRLVDKSKLTVNMHEVKRDTDYLGIFGVLLLKLISKISDLITVHTYEAKNILVNKCHIDSELIEVLPLSTFVSTHPIKNKVELQKKYNLTNSNYILFSGFIHIDKGIEHLIKAYSIIKQSNPVLANNYKLYIAGEVRKRTNLFKLFEKKDRKYLKSLKELVRDENISENVVFLGYIEDEYLETLLKNSTVVVLPYTNTEQSGVLNQVLPLSVPIIASNIGGLGETLQYSGVLIEPGNSEALSKAITDVLTNKDMRAQLRRAYTQLCEEINIDNTMRRYLERVKNI